MIGGNVIRQATYDDIKKIMEIINEAKQGFLSEGSTQWQDLDGYPNEKTFMNDIMNNSLYVYEDDFVKGVIAITFLHEDAYDVIYDGAWEGKKYSVVHRLAVKKIEHNKGIAQKMLSYAQKLTKERDFDSIRVDTMEENVKMRNLLEKCEYEKKGFIYLLRPNVLDPKRIAYEKIIK